MKILQYIPSIDEHSGGLGAYMQLLARDLGVLVELHVLTHHTNNERKLENATIHFMGEEWLPWNSAKNEFLIILNDIKPDLFHTNSCWLPLPSLTAIWAKDNGYKVIYTPHGMLEPYSIKRNYWTKKLLAIILFQRKGIKVSDLVHSTAHTEKENLYNLGWNKNIHVISNCVQIDDINIKTSWKRNKNILFLSRLHPKKGINFLIEAVAQLKDEITGLKIFFLFPFKKQLKVDFIITGFRITFFGKIYCCNGMTITQRKTYRGIFWDLWFCFSPIFYQSNIARCFPGK